MSRTLPVYRLESFKKTIEKNDFYCNSLNPHVKEHTFTHLPHKHDFYVVVIVTKGTGWHEIDFVRYKVARGSAFLMRPGQMHYWKLSDDIEGYVFFHSKDFYSKGYITTGIEDYPFFQSFQSQPIVQLTPIQLKSLSARMQEVLTEYHKPDKYAFEKIRALITLIYIEISSGYKTSGIKPRYTYLSRLYEFEKLIEQNFKEIKSAGEYAKLLNISDKHLNRITKTCLNKTATQLITDRLILEAKRALILSKSNISEVGYALGFTDISYFIRLFKKNTGITPTRFLSKEATKHY